MCYICLKVVLLCVLTKGFHTESDLFEYMQPDDADSGRYDNLDNVAKHICTRKCVKGENKICYYRFVFEKYVTMNGFCGDCPKTPSDCDNKYCVPADGFERGVASINRRMPGPSIQVCLGDLLIVDVKNMMPGCETAVHWHGIRQNNSKFMDGVPMVTQCPILQHDIFRYHILLEDYGTHFYHSHSGLQKVDGIVGSLIVRQPERDNPHAHLFDHDLPSHVILVQDWRHEPADDLIPGLQHRNIPQFPQTYLMQGKGSYENGSMPLATFRVKRGYRYVFRIIAGTCFECQYTMTIEKHDLTIIAADGPPTKPYKVNSLTMSPGERFTVVVDCRLDVGSFWIHARAVGFCESTKAFQLGILQYEGHNGEPSSPRPGYEISDTNKPGLTVNPFNSNCTSESRDKDGPCITDLSSAYETPKNILGKPNHRIIWAFGFYLFNDNKPFTNTSNYPTYIAPAPVACVASTVNGKSYTYPPSPLLPQWSDVPDNLYCPDYEYSESASWNVEYHQCTHVIKLPAYRVIEIVVCDATNFGMSHAIHLHGHDMHICQQGILPKGNTFNESLTSLLKYLDSKDREELSPYMVQKDTVPLAAGGWFAARIYTGNPGYWFYHCHFAYHLESGMSGVVKVGKHAEMPDPPEDFPKCGDYLPRLEDIDEYKKFKKGGNH